MHYGVTRIPPWSGLPGSVKVLAPTVTTSCANPVATPVKLTVQLSCDPADVPVHDAVYVLPLCRKLIWVVQLDAVALQGKLAPLTVKATLDKVPLARLTEFGVNVVTRGKVELVVNISRTFCR